MVNRVFLIGRLGKDPEMKHFEGGTSKANFTLATSEYYKDKDGNRKEQTEWHNIVVWGKQAEIAERYLKKGKLVAIEGKITNRSWEDNGVKKYITEIRAETFKMLDGKPDNAEVSSTPQQQPSSPGYENVAPIDDSDLPF